MKSALLLSLLAIALPSAAFAQDGNKEAAPAPAEESAAAELPRVAAGDMEGVRKLLGKKAVVFGKVTGASSNEKLGMTWLAMDGEKFTLVTWKDSYAKFPEGQSPAKIYKGAKIEVTGEIMEYKPKNGGDGKLQIKLTEPSQIKVIEEAGAKKDGGRDAKKDEAKAGAKKEK